MKNNKPKVIAEIGCAHGGDMQRAKNLIVLAQEAGAHCVKFQKRDIDLSTPEHMKDKPHPNAKFAFGKTYYEHRKKLELSIPQHQELKDFSEGLGVEYSTSVWDMPSLLGIITIKPLAIKIPSARNNDKNLIDAAYSKFDGEIHISLGMMDASDRNKFFQWFQGLTDLDKNRTVIYHCTSAYPCPFEHLYLEDIKDIIDFGCQNVGFSNHGYGIAADVAALAFGSRWFERHFIDDRLYPHNDASASLEPSGLSRLCRDLDNVSKALNRKPEGLIDLELEQKNKLRS